MASVISVYIGWIAMVLNFDGQWGKHVFVVVFQEPRSKTDIPQAELGVLLEAQAPQLCFEWIDLSVATSHSGGPSFFTPDVAFEEREYPVAHVAFLEQSAIVATNFQVNVEELVRRAGYVHSAGDLIFVCEWGTLAVGTVSELLVRHATKKKAFFKLSFYTKSAHADYPDHLPELCIDDGRYHVGQEAFVKAAQRIDDRYSVAVKDKRIGKVGDGEIFLYRDTGPLSHSRPLNRMYSDRSSGDYAVCYLSTYKKENPIHALDRNESKPYSAGIFTTPHRLVNAMLNLGRVKPGSVVVDPFCHTGTAAIEASHLGATVVSTDRSEPIGAEDNFEFLCRGAASMRKVCSELLALSSNRTLHDAFNTLATESIGLNSHGLPQVRVGHTIEVLMSSGMDDLDLTRLSQRLYFYLVRRFHMMEQRGSATASDSSEFARRFIGSPADRYEDKSESMTYFRAAALLEMFERATATAKTPTISAETSLLADSGFLARRVGYAYIQEGESSFRVADITREDHGLGPASVDAVVTDPPYGYGEDLDRSEVERIYRCLFERSFEWLRSGGFLVFCTLDKVRTGRTEDLLFTEDILSLLNRVARENSIAFGQRHVYPIERWPQFLFYWKSKYALNRAVIAVEVLK